MGKTRRAFTVSEKLKVIDWHQANGCVVKKTARQFDLNPKHVRDWLASHSVLLQNDFGNTRNKLRLYSGNRAEWPQVDQAVYQFFMSRRNANVKISDDDLKEFALQRAKDLDYQSFRASNGWLRRWKIRKGVRVRRGAKRTLPVEKEEQLTAFFDAVRTLRAEHDYGDVDILLMHQVTVRYVYIGECLFVCFFICDVAYRPKFEVFLELGNWTSGPSYSLFFFAAVLLESSWRNDMCGGHWRVRKFP